MATAFLGKEISGRFTIPSGIITTSAKTLQWAANNIPEIGVLTTKSVGLEPRAGNREPIITSYAPGCLMNAVGLTNPGAKEFAKSLSEIKLPKNKFLLVSIFGKTPAEFVKAAKILEPYADGFELNLSCPHATGYGMAIGQDAALVKEIISAVKKAVKVPVIPKLTPNAPSIADIAKAAVEGGADAICAINTVGPGYFAVEGQAVLTNKKGGMSGRGILPIGLKCIKEISEAVKVPLIGCGGICTAADVLAYESAGASIFGVGSALAGMNSTELKKYFNTLAADTAKGTNNAERLLHKAEMNFTKYKLAENKKLADDLSLLVFDKPIEIKPGQFVFAWIPGTGEKPFSVLDDNPLTLAVQKRGMLTEKLLGLEKGAKVYFRGPYGNEIKPDKGRRLMLVAGGTGIASLYQLARDFDGQKEVFVGARDKNHLYYLNELKKHSAVHVTTNDGSEGRAGIVTDVLGERLAALTPKERENIVFYNCGPEKMLAATAELERKYAPPEKILASPERITKCGIGICGACATKQGKRFCTDGPFMQDGEW